MIRGKLENGFEFEIDETSLDSMEFLDALSEMEENPLAFPKVCVLMLGKNQRKKLYDALREDGKVPVQKMSDAISEIFAICENELKNS